MKGASLAWTALVFLVLVSVEAQVNECVDGTHNCDADATCLDTQSSFTCICNTGYVNAVSISAGSSGIVHYRGVGLTLSYWSIGIGSVWKLHFGQPNKVAIQNANPTTERRYISALAAGLRNGGAPTIAALITVRDDTTEWIYLVVDADTIKLRSFDGYWLAKDYSLSANAADAVEWNIQQGPTAAPYIEGTVGFCLPGPGICSGVSGFTACPQPLKANLARPGDPTAVTVSGLYSNSQQWKKDWINDGSLVSTGSSNGFFLADNSTSTAPQWVRVDMGASYNVRHVWWWDRVDIAGGSNGTEIIVGDMPNHDDSGNVLCAVINYADHAAELSAAGGPARVECTQTQRGRYVFLRNSSPRHLTVRELEIYEGVPE
eukprot:1755216-Rhodomonas_salina.1